MIKAVIFDLDGVVIDSPKIYFKVMKEFLKNKQLQITDREVSNLINLSLKDELSVLSKKYSLKISYEDFLSHTLEKSLEMAKKELKTCEGLKELVSALKEKGFLLAIASNNNRKAVDFVLKKFALDRFFSAAVCGEDVLRGKPDPEIYLKAAQKLAVNPKECVALEDTEIGVAAVKSAGIKCIAVLNEHASKTSFAGADLVVKDLFELDAQKISRM